jgi:hypothetical protein
MRKGEELEILIAASVDLAEAQAIDPEKIRAKVEAILTIVITLLQGLKGNLTVIGIAFQAGKVVTAIRDIVALFKKT